METIPEAMTIAPDAGGIASSTCRMRGGPGTGNGPAAPVTTTTSGSWLLLMSGSYRSR